MRTILPSLVVIPLLAFIGIGLADRAEAASPNKSGYTKYCYGTPAQCMRGYRATRPAPRPTQRGYLPTTPRAGTEYDFPRFGTQRWWEMQEDQD
jgi:hypothetical protein